LNLLQTQCLNNDAPNLCQLTACLTVSNSISACSLSSSGSNSTAPGTLPPFPPGFGPSPSTSQPGQPGQPEPAPGPYPNPEIGKFNETLSNSGNLKRISWFIGLLLIIVNWLQ